MVVKKNAPAGDAPVRAPEGMSGLAKGLAIIEVFGMEHSQLTVTDAARLTDTTRAAARRCLLTLVELGYLSHDGKHFWPTPRFLRLGARLPAYGSATGQVLLAGLSDEAIQRYLVNPPPPTTAYMIVDPSVIMTRVQRARTEGVAFTDEELELGMRSMAVPVRNAQGKVVAAMSISTFSARLSLEELREQCLPVLQHHAAVLGCML